MNWHQCLMHKPCIMTVVIILSFPGVSFPEAGMGGGGGGRGGHLGGLIYPTLCPGILSQLPCDYPKPKHNCGAV